MSELDRTVFKQGMELMCTVFKREPDKMLLSAYYAILKGMEANQFESAVSFVLRDRKYTSLPLPADIIEAATGKLDDESLIALAKLERAMATWGAYRSIAFDDPVIHAFVSANGGWPFLCRMELDQWKFKRIEFVKSYKAFAPNLNRLAVPLTLAGADELSSPTLPVRIAYIGNPEVIASWQGLAKARIEHEKRMPEILAIADSLL